MRASAWAKKLEANMLEKGVRGVWDVWGMGELHLVGIVFGWVVGLSGEDEVGRDELGALVEELEERMLGVGAWLAEEDGTGRVPDGVSGAGYGLSVRLHGQLLEVGSKAVEVLIKSVSVQISTISGTVANLGRITEQQGGFGHHRSCCTKH